MAYKHWIYSFFGGDKDLYGKSYSWKFTEEQTKEDLDLALTQKEP